MIHLFRELVELYAKTGDSLDNHPHLGTGKQAKKIKKPAKEMEMVMELQKRRTINETTHFDLVSDEHKAKEKMSEEDEQAEWKLQRERMKQHCMKVMKNLNRLMAELEQ